MDKSLGGFDLLEKIAYQMNILGHFCGCRTLESLAQTALIEKTGCKKVDVLVLFGGSILAGGDVFAQAMIEDVAHHYIIVGGYGHTSDCLFKQMAEEIPGILQPEIQSEAELFAKYLAIKYHLTPDYLETKSTNCGNNITYLLQLLADKKIKMTSILMIQDATMQLRMDATLRNQVTHQPLILNYASYKASVVVEKNALVFEQAIPGMWEIEHYRTLLMGEIPRLYDTSEGYGPKGKQFIDHVDIPKDVLQAYASLKELFPEGTRKANSAFA